jgi:choline dehydrogenase
MRALSQGRVRIRSADHSVEPLIDHRYGTDAGGHDRAVLSEALDLLLTLTREPDLAAILGERANAEQDPLAAIASYCHPAGTAKMGPAGDPDAVVDASGAVHGVRGLYVADASIMPAISRGNINLPTAMIGARIAAGLLSITPAQAASTPIVETAK